MNGLSLSVSFVALTTNNAGLFEPRRVCVVVWVLAFVRRIRRGHFIPVYWIIVILSLLLSSLHIDTNATTTVAAAVGRILWMVLEDVCFRLDFRNNRCLASCCCAVCRCSSSTELMRSLRVVEISTRSISANTSFMTPVGSGSKNLF